MDLRIYLWLYPVEAESSEMVPSTCITPMYSPVAFSVVTSVPVFMSSLSRVLSKALPMFATHEPMRYTMSTSIRAMTMSTFAQVGKPDLGAGC